MQVNFKSTLSCSYILLFILYLFIIEFSKQVREKQKSMQEFTVSLEQLSDEELALYLDRVMKLSRSRGLDSQAVGTAGLAGGQDSALGASVGIKGGGAGAAMRGRSKSTGAEPNDHNLPTRKKPTPPTSRLPTPAPAALPQPKPLSYSPRGYIHKTPTTYTQYKPTPQLTHRQDSLLKPVDRVKKSIQNRSVMTTSISYDDPDALEPELIQAASHRGSTPTTRPKGNLASPCDVSGRRISSDKMFRGSVRGGVQGGAAEGLSTSRSLTPRGATSSPVVLIPTPAMRSTAPTAAQQQADGSYNTDAEGISGISPFISSSSGSNTSAADRQKLWLKPSVKPAVKPTGTGVDNVEQLRTTIKFVPSPKKAEAGGKHANTTIQSVYSSEGEGTLFSSASSAFRAHLRASPPEC